MPRFPVLTTIARTLIVATLLASFGAGIAACGQRGPLYLPDQRKPRQAPMTLPPQFGYRDGQLFIEEVSLGAVASRFGTPVFVYSRAALLDGYAAYADALADRIARDDAMICYAVKANSNIAILDLFARAGAGFDIVSGGELERVLAAGGDPARVVFSGVGKTREEMERALDVGIHCFNVESMSEARLLADVAAKAGKRAPVSLRINPDVDPLTHPYIATGLKESKFGIAYADAPRAYREVAALASLEIVGVDCHIGSQMLDSGPLQEALEKLLLLIERLEEEGIAIAHLDLGGGVGIRYGHEATDEAIDVASYLGHVCSRLDAWSAARPQRKAIKVLFEPGRSLVGNAGALLMRTLVLKRGATKNFAIVDAGMNDLLRPALYDAWHQFVPVLAGESGEPESWDIVGPVCESGDWLARDRRLLLKEGDLLACLSAGAYAMAMASNYNTRPRAAEVLVDGTAMHAIRDRESIASLFAMEHRVT